MKKILLVFMLALTVFIGGCTKKSLPSYMDETVYDYWLDVELLDDMNQLKIEGSLTFTNYIEDLEELKVMFYGNGTYYTDKNPNVNISMIQLNNEDVAYTLGGHDDQEMTIPLDKKYELDEEIRISFSYTQDLWSDGRLSYRQDAYYAMFFYPMIANYDGEWNTEPFSFRGENLYNKMSNFNVVITVPEEYKVALPNQTSEPQITDGKAVYRSYGEDMRDFSFSASKNYYVHEKTIDDIDFKIYDKGNHTTSEINTYFHWMEIAFETYETYVGPYYLDNFTLELGDIYGMESSGIIYCSSDVSEGTIVHEIVHQWFFFMIGNDQFDESFLDESLTTYATSLYFREMYGEVAYNQYLEGRSSLQTRLSEHYDRYEGQSLDRNVYEIGDGYAFIIYYHGPTLFNYYIEEFLDGDVDKFFSVMEEYYNQYVKRNATIDEFLTLLEEETKVTETKEWFELHMSAIQDLENRP